MRREGGPVGRARSQRLLELQRARASLRDEPVVASPSARYPSGDCGARAMLFSAACRARSAELGDRNGVGIEQRHRRPRSSTTRARRPDRGPPPARRRRAPSEGSPDRSRAIPADASSPLRNASYAARFCVGFSESCFFSPLRQREAQRLRHLRRDVGLHLEDVGERRVERLLPLRGRRAGSA